MDIMEAMRQRHAVRAYLNRPMEGETLKALEDCIAECNRESGLHIQLVKDEPKAFDSRMAHYGKFSGVTNYIAMVGKKGAELEEQCGYSGEMLVLQAQLLGLNTCWVAMTYKKIPGAFQVDEGEKLAIVIAIGYGATEGVPHKSKPAEAVSDAQGAAPDWFRGLGLVQQLQLRAADAVAVGIDLPQLDLRRGVLRLKCDDLQPVLHHRVLRQHAERERLCGEDISRRGVHFNGFVTNAVFQLDRDFHNAAFVAVPGVLTPERHKLTLRRVDLEADALLRHSLAGDGVQLHHLQVSVKALVVDDVAVGLVVFADLDREICDQLRALPAGDLVHGVVAHRQVLRPGKAVLVNGEEVALRLLRGGIAAGGGQVDLKRRAFLRRLHLRQTRVRVLDDLDAPLVGLLRGCGGDIGMYVLQRSAGCNVPDIDFGVKLIPFG